jgi:hypothetical protein
MRPISYIPPALILALLVASIYATLYNLWRNGSPRDLGFCLLAAWAGFALGQVAGMALHFDWGRIGTLHMMEGTVLAWAVLLLMNWLRMPHSRPERKKS